VAFDVDLEGEQSNVLTVTDGSGADNLTNSKFRLPRKLPKLSSLGRSNSIANSNGSIGSEQQSSITNENIIEKQRKADEKRLEMLEEKKQKARKFVEKFGNNKSAGCSGGSQEEEVKNEMNGLDSGLGLDGYGLEDESEGNSGKRIDTATSVPVVVQTD